MKVFNTTGVCIPSKHYMVDITKRLKEIKKMVDKGNYFTINRARQYGKTTTLNALKLMLRNEYTVLSLDFQSVEKGAFDNGGVFTQAISRIILDFHEFNTMDIPVQIVEAFEKLNASSHEQVKLDELFRVFKRWIVSSDKPMVLIIDEVDSASDSQVFLDFLAQLREGYITRDTDSMPAFQSVILAGVTDIKHLRSKIRDEDQHKVNSPWNIAADFDIDMSLSKEGIQGMLGDYEEDHNTGMNIEEMASLIHDYTSGYPFLVSRLCQLLDEEITEKTGDIKTAWSREGLDEAVKLILSENNTLFQSLTGKLENNPELKKNIHDILMNGTRIPFNAQQDVIALMNMYGFIKNENNTVRISNRIFETVLYNLFLTDEALKGSTFNKEGDFDRNIFVKDGALDMPLILEHFIKTYTQVFGPLEDKFREKDGREYFLLYLKPIINGTGNYYIEAQTRDQTRTDVIVDYHGKQYIVELKIWRGERYNSDGEKQVSEYLEYFGLDTGYMLSFNFNKNKEQGLKKVKVGDKTLYEATL